MGRDSDGIFQTLRDAALIQQTGGGNGFSFSHLRPKGDAVASSAGVATGPVGFLRVYDIAFGEVAQGGTRRGANMAVLRVDHPDIEEFVTCKAQEGQISNFNISVGITDAFMQAVEADADFALRQPARRQGLAHGAGARPVRQDRHLRPPQRRAGRAVPRRGEPRRTRCRICTSWKRQIRAASSGWAPTRTAASARSTWPSTSPPTARSTGRSCATATVVSTRFLDNVVDANKYVPAVPQLREAALRARRIGLGIMGLGDLMYRAGRALRLRRRARSSRRRSWSSSATTAC